MPFPGSCISVWICVRRHSRWLSPRVLDRHARYAAGLEQRPRRTDGATTRGSPMDRIWLITGANSGFGRALTEAAVAAGDTVVATARRTETLADMVAEH